MADPAEQPPSVIEFVELARTFCSVIESHATLPAPRFLERVHQLLPKLYAAALALPDIGWDAPECLEHRGKPTRDLGLTEKLGTANLYREIFDAYGPASEEPVIGSLADDLGDIHAELATALACWNAGNEEGAVWSWRFGFQQHWGEHLTSALRALYVRTFRYDLGPESLDEAEA